MTINECLSTLRESIKEVTDDSNYTDSFLYSVWNDKRNVLLSRRAQKKEPISDWIYSTFCVDLEKVHYHDCACVPYGCDVLRTKYQIPNSIRGRNSDLINVLTLSMNEIPKNDDLTLRYDVLDEMKAKRLSYTVHDRYIYIHGSLTLKKIQIKTVPETHAEWIGIYSCIDDLECPESLYDMNANIDRGLNDAAIDMVIQKLFPLKQQPDDTKQDRVPESRI